MYRNGRRQQAPNANGERAQDAYAYNNNPHAANGVGTTLPHPPPQPHQAQPPQSPYAPSSPVHSAAKGADQQQAYSKYQPSPAQQYDASNPWAAYTTTTPANNSANNNSNSNNSNNNNNYSPSMVPMRPGAQQPQQQQVSSFYNAQWDTSPQHRPLSGGSYGQANGMGAGMQQQQQHAMPHPQPLSPTPFYNPNASHGYAPQPQQQSFNAYQPPQAQQQQHNMPQQQQQAAYVPNFQNAVPLMMAGMQFASAAAGQAGGISGGGGIMQPQMAQIGRQMFQQMAPGAADYAHHMLSSRDAVNTFMRLPKYYFMVNHKYVRDKLLLLMKPWGTRTWLRTRSSNPAFEYLPPREDTNAPDLYIPLMSFATYVLLAGIVLGSRAQLKPGTMGLYLSKGGGVLTLEAVVIKLGLYLINAKATPWLDVIAYRGYKFVGVALTMAASLIVPRAYWPMLIYCASAMGLFLMRSHRRIVLPRDTPANNPAELARRNAFLLFLCALQYPVYWVLVLY